MKQYFFSHNTLPITFVIIADNRKEADELLKIFKVKKTEVVLSDVEILKD